MKSNKYDRYGRDKNGKAKPVDGPWIPGFLALVKGTERRRDRIYGGHLGRVRNQRHLDVPPFALLARMDKQGMVAKAA